MRLHKLNQLRKAGKVHCPLPFLLSGVLLIAGARFGQAQQQELAGSLNAIIGTDRVSQLGVPFRVEANYALGLDYEYRVWRGGPLSAYIGADLLVSPLRTISSIDRSLTRDVASLYLTPNLMVKWAGVRRLTPWAAVGGGLSAYEQSDFRIDGQRNTAPRNVTHGALMYGGGVDVPIWRWIALRGQIRNFYSGTPAYNAATAGGQHNVVAGGALVVRWGH